MQTFLLVVLFAVLVFAGWFWFFRPQKTKAIETTPHEVKPVTPKQPTPFPSNLPIAEAVVVTESQTKKAVTKPKSTKAPTAEKKVVKPKTVKEPGIKRTK